MSHYSPDLLIMAQTLSNGESVDGTPNTSPTKPDEDSLFFFTNALQLHEEVVIEALRSDAAPVPLNSATPYVRLARAASPKALAKQLKVLTMRLEELVPARRTKRLRYYW
jgi:hypothetical protein